MKLVRRFLVNGAVMTLTAVITRLMTVLFNAYLTNRIGASGVGLFSLVMSVYTLGVTFASSGIYLSSTRLISKEIVKDSGSGVRRALSSACLYSAFFGTLSAILLHSLAPVIAEEWLGDIRTLSSLRILSFSLVPLAISSAISGYFSAVRRVVKNAVTNILEQLFRIAFTVMLLIFFTDGGIKEASEAIVIGITVSEMLSFAVSFLLYLSDRKKLSRMSRPASEGIMKELIKTALPIAVSSYIRSALTTLEHILIPKGLMKGGLGSEAALASYGVISGMVFPVIFFPMAFLTSFTGLIVPEITRYQELNDRAHIEYVSYRVMSVTLIFSVFISAVLIFNSELLGMLIYGSTKAGRYIRVFSLLIPVMYADNTADAVLKGLGLQVSSMRYNIVDAAVSVILVLILLPRYGIGGYVVVIYVCELLNAVLSMQKLFRTVRIGLKPFKNVIFPVLAAIGSVSVYALIVYFTKSGAGSAAIDVAESCFCMLVFYYIFLRSLGSVTDDDEKWLIRAVFGRITEKRSQKIKTFSR